MAKKLKTKFDRQWTRAWKHLGHDLNICCACAKGTQKSGKNILFIFLLFSVFKRERERERGGERFGGREIDGEREREKERERERERESS